MKTSLQKLPKRKRDELHKLARNETPLLLLTKKYNQLILFVLFLIFCFSACKSEKVNKAAESLGPPGLNSSNAIVSGKLVDRTTQKALDNVTVSVYDKTINRDSKLLLSVIQSQQDGTILFRLPTKSKHGILSLHFQKQGYADTTIYIRIAGLEVINLYTLSLTPLMSETLTHSEYTEPSKNFEKEQKAMVVKAHSAEQKGDITAIQCEKLVRYEVENVIPGAMLLEVLPARGVFNERRDGGLYYEVEAWAYGYKTAQFVVYAYFPIDNEIKVTPKVTIKDFIEKGYTPNLMSAYVPYIGEARFKDLGIVREDNFIYEYLPIINWRIDSDEALRICQKVGFCRGEGYLGLRMWQVNGVPTPIWTVPYTLENFVIFGIDATSGRILIPAEKGMNWTEFKSQDKTPSSQLSSLTIEISLSSTEISLSGGKIDILMTIKNPSNREIMPSPDAQGMIVEGYTIIGLFGYGSLYFGDPIPSNGTLQRKFVLTHTQLIQNKVVTGNYQLVGELGTLKSKPVSIQVRQ